MALLIKNIGVLATQDDAGRELKNAWIVVDGPAIAAIGEGELPKRDDITETVDAKGALAIPGMVNTHHHLYQTFQKNVPFVQDAKLFDWLVGLYEIWRELTPEDVRVSAQVGLGELLLSGCTTVADHFYVFPKQQTANLLDETIHAARAMGVRFHPSRGSMSRGKSKGGLPPDDVVQSPDAILCDSERVVAKFHDASRYSMCRLALAPCSPFSVTDDLLLESARLARKLKVRLHTHLAETEDENDFCRQMVGKRPLDYMASVEWLGPDVWYAHGVWLNDDELKLMAETGTGIAHCPCSNLRLGSGIAPIPKAVKMGVPVGLAVDGSASNDASDMLRELQLCTIVHRVTAGVDAMPARSALRLATRGGARVLGRDDIGQLAPGMAADIVLFRMDDIGLAGAMHDPVAALSFTTGMKRADKVMVNGKWVVQDGHLVHLDERATFAEANRLAHAMIERAHARTGIDFFKHRV
ncbi:MAG: 8-oxoguanine deaminase [Myxococcales bacterium]|jgi:cytosine/adenosine deaminase-related metal-dependent hydrolase|nr:8-oxoguanine deaminase [Myxococcales bacterium]